MNRKPDPKVKKTLVRNPEQRIRSATQNKVVREVASTSTVENLYLPLSPNERKLSEPTLCSSRILANYLADVKQSEPPPISAEDLNIDRGKLCAEMTKKLNFHMNDKIYKNLVELNANVDIKSNKKDKRPSHLVTSKKDLEPNIEDFFHDEDEPDSPPPIPIIRPKFKPVRKIEDGQLHRLVAQFEEL